MTGRGPLAPDRWQRLGALFDELSELSGARREERRREIEASDPDLVAPLAGMLAADAADPGLLESPLLPRARTAEDPESVEAPPRRAGAYRLGRLLGRGGMADVYEAERDDGAFEQRVAVKILRRGLDSEDLLARFLRERRILARLEHPAIARLLDGGALSDGRPYFVMELVLGEPLDRYAERRNLPVEERVRLLTEVSEAVASAHRALVVHRDLKPSNVLVNAAGELKLLDFGIAKLLDPEPGSTQTQRESRVLTPAYAAPEQLVGAPTTTATDVWGLGALGFALLAGEPPYTEAAPRFAGPTARTVRPGRASARLRERAERLGDAAAAARRRAARLAGDLDLVLEKALALEPKERYPSAEAFADDLSRFLAARPVAARPPSWGYRLSRFVRRQRAAAIAIAVAIASLAVGGSLALWQARRAASERARPLSVTRYLSFSGSDGAPAFAPRGERFAFSSRRDGRRRIWTARLAGGDEAPLTGGEDDDPRFSADGERLLFTRVEADRRSLFVVAAGGGEARRCVEDALFGDFAPDGRIAFVRQTLAAGGERSRLFVVAGCGAEERPVVEIEGRVLVPPRWSPDGHTIALARSLLLAGQRGAILLVDAASGGMRVFVPGGNSPSGLAWVGPDRLAYSQPDSVTGWVTGGSGRIVVENVSGASGREVFSSASSVGRFDLDAAGRLAFESATFRVRLQEVELAGAGGSSGAMRWLTRGESSDRQPRSSPDGGRLVFSSNRGGNIDLWTVSRSGLGLERITDDPAFDWDPAFTADGRLLWSTNRGGPFEIWIAEADGSGARQVTRDGVDAENPTMTPDGSWIVYNSGNPRSRGLFRIRPDGSEAQRIVPGEVKLPELSPDGRFVAYVENLGSAHAALRVARVEDGAPVDFAIALPAAVPESDPEPGRCRWFPDGRALALVDRAPGGGYAVFRHPFAPVPEPGRPSEAPQLLAASPDFDAESLDVSPDGRRLTVAYWDRSRSLFLAENLSGVGAR